MNALRHSSAGSLVQPGSRQSLGTTVPGPQLREEASNTPLAERYSNPVETIDLSATGRQQVIPTPSLQVVQAPIQASLPQWAEESPVSPLSHPPSREVVARTEPLSGTDTAAHRIEEVNQDAARDVAQMSTARRSASPSIPQPSDPRFRATSPLQSRYELLGIIPPKSSNTSIERSSISMEPSANVAGITLPATPEQSANNIHTPVSLNTPSSLQLLTQPTHLLGGGQWSTAYVGDTSPTGLYASFNP